MNKEDKIEMLSQSLMTEDGYLNPACMYELESTINNMPKTYNRLANDSEWSIRKNKWTFKKDIVGAFAMWACRQSPYGVPDGLENVCKYLNAALESCGNGWKNSGMQECSLVDINKWLHEILYEQGVIEFDKWNECKMGNAPDINFVSVHDEKRNPDRDFIDLDALLHNVCLTIRDERRKDNAFNDKFDKEYPNNKVTGTFK
jgi:hypothetical protein